MRPGRTTIGAGGAIVMQSDPEEEFDEILLKARAPMAAIARTVTGSDAPEAWSVELEPAAPAGGGGVSRAGGDGADGSRGGSRRRRGRSPTAVESLLVELGGRTPARPQMEAEVRALLDDPAGGVGADRGGRRRDRRRAQPPAGSGRSTFPASTRRSRTSGSMGLAQSRRRGGTGRGDRVPGASARGQPARGRPAAGDLRGDRFDRVLLRAQRVRAPRAADAEAAVDELSC